MGNSLVKDYEKWDSWYHPDLNEIIASRYELLKIHKNSKKLQQKTLDRCKEDVVFWLNAWCWTYDPRLLDLGVNPRIPFLLFPIQREYLLWRLERRKSAESGLVEKSRDMGLTWLNVASQTHSLLFEDGFKGAFGSRKAKYVDDLGNLDAIFPKIRFLIKSLPDWMRPRIGDSYMRILNIDNGSMITGESGDDLGRGGRCTIFDWDEVAFTERAEKVDAALSQNTHTVIYTSTPNGNGNLFYQKRHSGKIPTFIVDWKDDPRKNDSWYLEQCQKLDPIVVAQEIDRDYGSSQQNSFIKAEWVRTAVNVETKLRNKLKNYSRFGQRRAGLDVATEGKNRNVLTIVEGFIVIQILDWNGLDITQTANQTRRICLDNQVPTLVYDQDGVGAGIPGAYNAIPIVGIDHKGVHGAGSPTQLLWEAEKITSKQKFANLRAEIWFLTRERFRKTYEVINDIASYPLEELISIPDHKELVSQLSTPKIIYRQDGKILVESKESMIKRGVQSPDYADSLCYALFNPPTMSNSFKASTARYS